MWLLIDQEPLFIWYRLMRVLFLKTAHRFLPARPVRRFLLPCLDASAFCPYQNYKGSPVAYA
jgi:hemolysin-activating ACP:hemolysin acyltransferase